MIYGWKAADIRAAIDRCERETEALIRKGAAPEQIYQHRKGVTQLRAYLAKAEEHGAGAVERGAES
ncbi:MAG: hypothetical protein IKS52_04645 [Clostridia bacterium]|nr:hypothetical protein [Clostridia bacterium]